MINDQPVNNQPLPTTRIPALDGLRALAIMLVVACHVQVFLKPLSGPLARFCVEVAWSGVYLFFVLSGYLVGSLAISELTSTGKLHIRKFWLRRMLRTWPLYYLALFGNYLVMPAYGGPKTPSLLWFMTFTQIFTHYNYFIESWTLCIEEQFYLLLPVFMVVVVWLMGVKRIWMACLFVIALSYIFRFRYGYLLHPGATFDSLFVGVLIANWHRSSSRGVSVVRAHSWLVFFLGVAIFGSAFVMGGTTFSQFQGLVSIGFGLILIAALNPRSWLASFLGARIFKVIAISSYSTYLIHVFAILCLRYLGLRFESPLFWPIATLLFIGAGTVALVAGWLVYRLVEEPCLRLREVIAPRRGKRNLQNESTHEMEALV